jgi:membrane-associated phospholipid phosphatase
VEKKEGAGGLNLIVAISGKVLYNSAMPIRLKPVDLLSLLFLALLSAIAVLFFHRIPHGGWLLTRFGMLIAAIALLAWYATNSSAGKPGQRLYRYLPIFIVPVVFDSLGDMIPWLWHGYFDDALIRVDFALFGVHPTVWMERFIHPLLTTALQFAYISYYPMTIVLAVTLAVKGREEQFDEAVFGIILCFYLSYLGYILIPAVGPRYALAHLQTQGLEAGPLVVAIQETLNALENTKTDAFPSGHTAIAVVTLFYAWKMKENLLAVVLLPTVTALIFSTVYLRYHYVIDVVAGVLLAVATLALAPATRRWLSSSGRPAQH